MRWTLADVPGSPWTSMDGSPGRIRSRTQSTELRQCSDVNDLSTPNDTPREGALEVGGHGSRAR